MLLLAYGSLIYWLVVAWFLFGCGWFGFVVWCVTGFGDYLVWLFDCGVDWCLVFGLVIVLSAVCL